jgi:DNA (cytosine-5)-methyltransferase 1
MKWAASARDADLNLMANSHAWFLSDLETVPKNGLKVMSTFACGGGSSMGYKRAGCTIVAANDIDPEMAWHYKRNLNPQHYFLCPIRDLLTADLPAELFNLDILDGSPPCSTFSMAGSREKAWGKEKHFREGQAKQVLSDLFFDYLDLVGRLRPKVAIAENVKGMLIGNAKGYTKMVNARFKELGYRPQLFLLNAADCGVPQKRERVFFCAVRDDIDVPPLVLKPQHRWVSAGEATADLQQLTAAERKDVEMTELQTKYWKDTEPGSNFTKAVARATGKASWFNNVRMSKDAPVFTLSSQPHKYHHWADARFFTYREWKRFGAFPDDYEAKTDKIGKYMIGMSVPPKMTEQVARAVIDQWLLPEVQSAAQTA